MPSSLAANSLINKVVTRKPEESGAYDFVITAG